MAWKFFKSTGEVLGVTPSRGWNFYSSNGMVKATGSSSDANAIHDNVAGEIAAISEKVSPVSADLLLIEDSAAGNAKKKIQIGNLPGGGGAVDAMDVTYSPAVLADWDAGADPGDVDNALDQLAERVTDVEAGGGGGGGAGESFHPFMLMGA